MESMIGTVLATSILVIFAGLAFVAWDDGVGVGKGSNSTLLYNHSSAMLSLQKPFEVEIWSNATGSDHKLTSIGKFKLPDPSKATVSLS